MQVSGSRAVRALRGRLKRLRSHATLSPTALLEAYQERHGGYPVDSTHRSHLDAALSWLAAAQDATPDQGFARGYSLTWHPEFGAGWQPSYPETTGYIIPTLYEAARDLRRPELVERAERAARWELEIQLPTGAVRAGVVTQPAAPAVFNTGQVMFGWLAAFRATGDSCFADAALRAGEFLVTSLDTDGLWRRNNSPLARADSTLYNAQAAWALAEAGAALNRPAFLEAAAANLWAVARLQHVNGWLPHCCLNDPDHPLLHTLGYAIRGLLEGGRVLEDDRLRRHAIAAADPLARLVRDDGWMPGRVTADWQPAVRWSCLTGNAQMANIWLRLLVITGESRWLQPVSTVLRFLKSTQNRSSPNPGVRGGIKGSAPVSGEYGRYQLLNWATKYFVDALLRDERTRTTGPWTGEDERCTLA